MSSIDNLFGSVDSSKVESTVSKLFDASNEKKVDDALSIKSRLRTILPTVTKRTNDKVESNEEESEATTGTIESEEPSKKRHKKKSTNDESDHLEEKYFAKLLKEDSEDKEETADLNKSSNEKTVKSQETKAKKIDLREDDLEKAERTLFVGNLTSEAIISKSIYKEFKNLFATIPKISEDDVETTNDEDFLVIESIRFRSISFDEALPRKVAFVRQKLHKSRQSVNAYIVYKNKKSIKPIISALNGKVFHNRHLKVDSVTHPAPHDKKRSIFVGNLDFEEDEESLWNHFSKCGEIEYVRIIRDSKTNLGKGFAYVQFSDLSSVNKALLLNNKPMASITATNKKSRNLRISRCKNMKKTQDSTSKSGKFSNLSEAQKTKMGRARKALGKADKAALGKELTIEGTRATKGDNKTLKLKKKKQRSKTGRVTKRSIAFKEASKKKDA
ncbi:hypothetical protein KAFR_0D01270 [Kazachstania africana CBS 2517]|uniref:Nucleolar protein 12 n=1 Tax=Kazachstania africana (strain ATCC 22294 / BCRC 22015 / CBS 2517 / CECT 1963 / NBRC 1671 / NRRL Y-8276) TaxID=1071382 RepID=H2ATS3_KAZAF|nr:hypothetical protein KAFR_0D01270 [Kazachstania africana CBS 2517]CCF57773.1 hypothetical protein KAFR_0D01270 [Kazachstania africana CBS 2517]